MKLLASLKTRLATAVISSCVLLGSSPSFGADKAPTQAPKTEKSATKTASTPRVKSLTSTKSSAKTSSTKTSSSATTVKSSNKPSQAKSKTKSKTKLTSQQTQKNKSIAATNLSTPTPIVPSHFTAARSSLFLTINGKSLPYQRFFYNLLPKQPLELQLNNTNEAYELSIDGQIIPDNGHKWTWQGPDKPGVHQLQLVEKLTHKTLNVSLFVMSPLKSNLDNIRGFVIGRYPPPKDGKVEYEAPKGFIEVTPENEKLYISPHFQLGQFICKQKGGYPQYVALQPELLEKLELLLAAINQKGFRLDSFEVMSGFRTPFYNRMIRNVIHSRHIYGSAADIFVDVNPRDGVMDDLNGDKKYNKQDAAYLYNLADDISRTNPSLSGGVGQYSGNGAHGPFVHVDVRGSEARWGM